MVRQWVCGVVVVAVILGAQGLAAPAMAKQPSDYYGAELLVGEIGALAGGLAGVALPGVVSSLLRNYNIDFSSDWFFTFSWGLWRALGAGVGVTYTGESFGVQGNVIMAYLLPGVSLVALPIIGFFDPSQDTLDAILWFLGDDFRRDSSFNPLAIPHLPFVPAVLAVIGFNIGATMKDTGKPASLPWSLDLPVLSWEF